MGNANANQIVFGQIIKDRHYNGIWRTTNDNSVHKGDIVIYDKKYCIVMQPYINNWTTILKIVELEIKNNRYVCPEFEPIYYETPGIEHKSFFGKEYVMALSEEPIKWLKPNDCEIYSLLRCGGEMSWEQYKQWFSTYWTYIQYKLDVKNGVIPIQIKDSPEKQELICKSIRTHQILYTVNF